MSTKLPEHEGEEQVWGTVHPEAFKKKQRRAKGADIKRLTEKQKQKYKSDKKKIRSFKPKKPVKGILEAQGY